jgi:hypothetical protein
MQSRIVELDNCVNLTHYSDVYNVHTATCFNYLLHVIIFHTEVTIEQSALLGFPEILRCGQGTIRILIATDIPDWTLRTNDTIFICHKCTSK